MAVEIALSVPLVVLLLFVLHAALQLGRAAIDVNAAAAAASRAASLSRVAAGALTAARDAATTNLAGQCASLGVDVNTSNFRRGGAVTVTVACTITTRRLTGVGVGGSVTTRASSTSPIDVYRGVAIRAPDTAARPAGHGNDGEAP